MLVTVSYGGSWRLAVSRMKEIGAGYELRVCRDIGMDEAE